MYGLIIGIIIFICVLLVLIVLVQNPKGGGLASGFASSNQFMGVKRTADFIEKATWSFAGALALLCIIATMLPHNKEVNQQTNIQDQVESRTMENPGNAPAQYPTAPASQQSAGQNEQKQQQPQQPQQPQPKK
jgi:preprotein translocase subunit SecG